MSQPPEQTSKWEIPWAALAIAACFSISPIFIRKGLEELDSPLLGVTVGMVVNVFAYGVVLFVQREKWRSVTVSPTMWGWQVVAAFFVAVSTWARWIAIDLAEVAPVLAIGRISVPVVLIMSPFLLDKKHERITRRVWLGAAFIVAGSMLLIFDN